MTFFLSNLFLLAGFYRATLASITPSRVSSFVNQGRSRLLPLCTLRNLVVTLSLLLNVWALRVVLPQGGSRSNAIAALSTQREQWQNTFFEAHKEATVGVEVEERVKALTAELELWEGMIRNFLGVWSMILAEKPWEEPPEGWESIDYAASDTGGKVVGRLSAPTYSKPGQLVSTDMCHLLGYKSEIGARTLAITPGPKAPGKCWPMHGTSGSLTVTLSNSIRPTSVTIEHIPSENSTAPKRFRVLGWTIHCDVNEPLRIHSKEVLMYDIHAPEPVQTFELDWGWMVDTTNTVTLEVLDNWGNTEFTCMYGFGVHGKKIDDV